MAHSFKFKPSKVKFTKEHRTLDEIHRETIDRFDEINNQINSLKQKIYFLEKKYLDESLDLEKKKINYKIKELRLKLNELINSNDELDYFEKTRDILLKYYKDDNKIDLGITEISDSDDYSEIEMKPISINTDTEGDPVLDRLNKLNELNNKNIKEKKTIKKKKNIQDKPPTKSILSFLSGIENEEVLENNISKIINERGTLKEQYLSLTDSKYMCEKVKLSPIKKCTSCNIEKTLIHSEGIYVCQDCGKFEYVIIESEVPSHKDSLNEKPKYPYKTINHLIERLNQFQAKQTTVIPKNIYKLIEVEIKKMVIGQDEITPVIIKKILKKYRLNLFYEHNYLIFSHVTNTPPPSLTRDEEDEIKNMFRRTEKPFKKYKPGDRANYLNYSYVLHKLFLIIGTTSNSQATKERMKNNSKYFSLLKSRDKLRIQDLIWKNICKDLNWPYHPSF
jgi:predicted RNA-binding Zn-ribbon protein involved in translation (DUF1610 family)